jgi:hypothetical protein
LAPLAAGAIGPAEMAVLFTVTVAIFYKICYVVNKRYYPYKYEYRHQEYQQRGEGI